MNNSVENLVNLEARLLDAGNLDDWLKLYSEQATYWVPMDENADPLKNSSIMYETFERLSMRVHQILREARVAQSPPSQMMRMITNIEVEQMGADSDTALARWNLLLVESRAGDWRQHGLGEVRMFPAKCEARFQKAGGEWQFIQKKIVLLNRMLPMEGLSFII